MNPAAIDTIAAIATAPGSGGIAIVRVSGPAAIDVVARVLGKAPDALGDRQVVVAAARDADGARIDSVVAFAMRGPRSFTGEDVAEIHGHGGGVNSARLLRAVLAAGARSAEPGEFTRRAFLHGKLDLTRAEALAGVIGAASERAWRVAQDQLEGQLGRRIDALRADAIGVLAELEASIDFPEEGLGVELEASTVARLRAIAAASAALAGSFRVGRALRDGIVVALAGPVNAGKSSLFNALVGRERSIVAATPGTTRDYVEARVEWRGVAVTLIDTAGERAGDDVGEIERRGIALATERLTTADAVLWIAAASEDDAGGARFGARGVLVRSKADLGTPVPVDAIASSAVTGAGLDELRAAALRCAGIDSDRDDGATGIVTSERQRAGLSTAAGLFEAAATALTAKASAELIAVDVRDGVRALAEVTGVEVGEAVLDELFARFCIGK
ncbi:MAG: tRNA uridine-5-carboxymethylaminomethyl(34) synthesis GTPase MnmE [Deltaproteobacteria bacterium]|nr:tRNA uridine-5-carboxymethylaminomethyl(34) synthesis GTPase MnmE [Deltaproteobacteria bacterium]